jgi:hypothetical protein
MTLQTQLELESGRIPWRPFLDFDISVIDRDLPRAAVR